MKRITVTLVLLALWVILFASCSTEPPDTNEQPEEKDEAIKLVEAECIKAGIITEEELNEAKWAIDSYCDDSRIGLQHQDFVDENGVRGVHVSMEGTFIGWLWLEYEWLVFDKQVYRIDNKSGKYTPHLPLYLDKRESEYDPMNPGEDLIGDVVKVARDIKTIDATDFVTTRWDIYMQSAPSQDYNGEFNSAIAIVPGDIELPILAWICTFTDFDHYGYESPHELWIRTEYNGMKGWVCAWEQDFDMDDFECYVDIPEDSLFKMTVNVDKLKFIDNVGYRWLEKGDEISFFFAKSHIFRPMKGNVSSRPENPLNMYASVISEGKLGIVNLSSNESDSDSLIDADEVQGLGWLVELDQRLLELNCEYYYHNKNFASPFVASLSDEIPYGVSTIFYVDGSWAALGLYTPSGGGKTSDWFNIGTKENPRLCIFEYMGNGNDILYVRSDEHKYQIPYIEILLRDAIWPDDNAYFVDLRLFEGLNEEDLFLNSIGIVQPPNGQIFNNVGFEEAYPNVSPNYADSTMTYKFAFPESINKKEPYSIDFTLHWSEKNRDLKFTYQKPPSQEE